MIQREVFLCPDPIVWSKAAGSISRRQIRLPRKSEWFAKRKNPAISYSRIFPALCRHFLLRRRFPSGFLRRSRWQASSGVADMYSIIIDGSRLKKVAEIWDNFQSFYISYSRTGSSLHGFPSNHDKKRYRFCLWQSRYLFLSWFRLIFYRLLRCKPWWTPCRSSFSTMAEISFRSCWMTSICCS